MPLAAAVFLGIWRPSRSLTLADVKLVMLLGSGSLVNAGMPSIDEITQQVGADSLGYLTLDGMLESVPGGPTGFCHACFSGDYPTPPPADPEKLRFGCGC